MKTKITGLIALFLALVFDGRSAERQTGFYFIGDVGLNLVENISFDRLLGVNSSGLPSVKVDPGARATIGVGYDFIPGLGAELEAGVAYNETRTYSSVIGGVPLNGSITLWQVPVTAGLTWHPLLAPEPRTDVDIDYGQRFIQNLHPFIGGGVGASGIFAEINRSAPTTNPVDADGHDIVLTYFLKAGLMYALSDRAEVGLQYRFYGNPGFAIKQTESDHLFSHAISLAFRFRF
jgi:opacity protein-like surface antigen